MPLLYLAMAQDGYLTEDGMAQVAALIGLTPAQVLSVASFYTMYKTEPVGRYLVSCCTSISCMLLGSDDVMRVLEEETGHDDPITIEHAECLGACGGAVAVQVNYELIEGITTDRARQLVQWLRKAQPEVVNTDEMQNLFGGRRSFEWAIADEEGAVGPVPAFGPLATTGRSGS